MSRTVKRLAAVAVVGAIGALAPVTGASAATTALPPAGFPLPAAGLPLPAAGLPLPAAGLPLPAFPVTGTLPPLAPLAFTGPGVGGLATVIGPTVITTAPSTFNNTNIQTSAGSNLTGGQAGPG
jgi:hypothetical protein